MRIASKLRGAFALYAVLLCSVLVLHVHTTRRAADAGHALSAISARLRLVGEVQLARLAELDALAKKYLVTLDRDYVSRLVAAAAENGEELRRLDTVSLSASEAARARLLLDRWSAVERSALRLAADTTPPTRAVVGDLEHALDAAGTATQHVRDASQSAMTRTLAAFERAAITAERVSWVAAAGALLLSGALSVMLIRAIATPLERLAAATRQISAGRYGYRVDPGDNRGDEFAQVARDFNAMTERLEELDRLKRELVSNVSHDLKTPLSSMQETTAAMLDELGGPLSEKQRRLLTHNQESGRRLSSMVTKLLDLSRLEAQRTPELELLDVVDLARNAVDRAANARAAAGRPAVTLSAARQELLLRADRDGLDRLLDNLLENAIKFSPLDGMVRVAVAEAPQGDGSVLLTVADEGPGIPDADKERVFDRFYQTQAGRATRSHGVGLGLSICRNVVTAQRGTIWVEDNEPHGAKFRVLLRAPVSAAMSEASDERPTLVGASP